MTEMMGMQTNRRDRWRAKLINDMAGRMLKEHKGYKDGMNARQAFQNARGGAPKVVVPKIQRCKHKAPEKSMCIPTEAHLTLKQTVSNSLELEFGGPKEKKNKNRFRRPHIF